MKVQAKFWVSRITHQAPASKEADTVATVEMQPAYGEGNEDWSKWTPSGKIEMTVTNPHAIEQFEVGGEYLLTFERAPAE